MGTKFETHSQKIEVATSELLKLMVTIEGEEDIDLSARSASSVATPKSSMSRRSSVAHVDPTLPPGEAAEARKRKRREEIREESYALVEHFSRKNFDALVHSTKVTLERIRRALTPPISLDYTGQKQEEKFPVLKLQLELCIPNLILRPSLEDVQSTLGQVVQTVLGTHKNVLQWGQRGAGLSEVGVAQLSSTPSGILAAASHVLGAPSSNTLPSPSQPHVLKKPELKNFQKMVSEHKDVAKLVSSLSSIVTAGKNQVIDSYKGLNKYQDLWQDEQSAKSTEFLESDPTLGDFEAKIHYYEQLEEVIMSEEEQIVIGPFLLDTCEWYM